MKQSIKDKLFEIIFEADTKAGKLFDIGLLITICLSIIVVVLESVPAYRLNFSKLFFFLEWAFTSIFLIEYILRITVIKYKLKYVFSFFGLIDLLAILPAFIAFFFVGVHSLIIIRTFRLLRVFRILKISRYSRAGQTLATALKASRAKIGVFLFSVIIAVIIIGTLMYLIEGEANGYTSIPKSIYWAIVTLTTVGYGDLTPQSAFGQFVSSLVMIFGYAIIAVPTGIISVEIARSNSNTQVCPSCLKDGHDDEAKYCKHCSAEMNSEEKISGL